MSEEVKPPCHYCGRPSHGRDHVIPRLLGGPDGGWNRVPACSECDGRKGSNSYESFTGKPMLPEQCREKGFVTSADWCRLHGHNDFDGFRRAILEAREKARELARNDRVRNRKWAEARQKRKRRKELIAQAMADHPYVADTAEVSERVTARLGTARWLP